MKKIVVLLVLCSLTGCSYREDNYISQSYYISFTTTFFDQGYKNHVYTYDFSTKKVNLKDTLDYTTGYPLATYYKGYIFYVKRPYYQNFVGQSYVFRKNLENKKEEVLSKEFSKFNDLRPLGRDTIFMVGSTLKNPMMTPAISSSIKFDPFEWKTDDYVHLSNYNPKDNEFILLSNSYSKEIAQIRDFNNQKTEDTEVDKTITLLKGEKITPLTKVHDHIQTLYKDGKNIYYVSSKNVLSSRYLLKSYNISTKKTVEFYDINDIFIKVIVFKEGDDLYFIGNKEKTYGLYKFDMKTKNIKILFKIQEVINNGQAYENVEKRG